MTVFAPVCVEPYTEIKKMTALHIVFEEPAFPIEDGKPTHHITEGIGATMLVGGMTSGAPSVAFVATLEDGSHLMLETSLAALEAFVAACHGRLNYLRDLDRRQEDHSVLPKEISRFLKPRKEREKERGK
jgi:hypothetical protein